jgi:hypothetical protein
MSTEIGNTAEVFVQPYPPTSGKYQISTDVGVFPLWSPDGKQIFYLSTTTGFKIVAVDVRTEPAFSVGKPVTLPIGGFVQPAPGMRNFDITPDGKQFITVMSAAEPNNPTGNPHQIQVVLNWFEELKQRVPLK